MRMHLVNNLRTDLLQLVCRSVATCAFLRVYVAGTQVEIVHDVVKGSAALINFAIAAIKYRVIKPINMYQS